MSFIILLLKFIFQSTHPVRGGTIDRKNPIPDKQISIHPPREGWDRNGTHK